MTDAYAEVRLYDARGVCVKRFVWATPLPTTFEVRAPLIGYGAWPPRREPVAMIVREFHHAGDGCYLEATFEALGTRRLKLQT